MDPIRFVNKAYSMVQSVERQKEVHMEIADTGDHTAMHVQAGIRKDISFRGDQKRRNFVDKRQLYCEHVRSLDIQKIRVLKIHETPDWYKDLVEQKRKDVNGTGSGRNFAANTEDRKVQSHLNEDSKELLLKELIKLVRGTHPEPVQQVNFAQLDDFAGIVHQTSCSYTPQQNGVVERKHKHLLTWPELYCFSLAYHRNSGFTSKAPDYEQLKVFGCLCFASNVNPHKAKFDQRASRDVMFHETTYPFQSIPPENDPISLPLPIDDTDPIPSSRVSNSKSHLLPNNSPTVSVSPGISPTNITLPIPLSTRPQRHEPKTYLQASKDANWVMAMQEELQALDKNGTWELTSLPPTKRAIGSKWVFKLKLHPDGSIARYKARLVAKGYNQIEGVDYFDSFSPVAKSVIVAKSKSWALFQLDINNAFLHGHLDEELYMDHPEGYLAAKPGQMCRLRRSLYGLKQASRQ
ncbi:UNVERIFIED_CONTAM: Retrovirus-related Pol polyprotein from transposon RE2 [Sesamum calycinum]|uniref:Retrovirus-related Pol polyprotein from transposon RE2 n=1 Tax=Sesamum calycinum TaxID=2727403 RepID=A0AAW2N1U7_9LAMI